MLIKRGIKITMKKFLIVLIILSALLAAGGILSAVILSAAENDKTRESIENNKIHTETEPIYNHFPDLPGTSEIQWCSQSSGGIGLTTTTLCFFAFYDRDVSGELQEMNIESQGENIELYFVPDGINEDEKWRRVESEGNAFPLQTGVRESARFYADVYINEAGTILYVEAVGD